jgi:hypothetical protein
MRIKTSSFCGRHTAQSEGISILEVVMMKQWMPPRPVDRFVWPSRRRAIGQLTCTIGGVAVFVAATPADAKMTLKAAGYQTTPKDGQSCANCALYRAPAECTLVDGDISPNGWCRFYSKK